MPKKLSVKKSVISSNDNAANPTPNDTKIKAKSYITFNAGKRAAFLRNLSKSCNVQQSADATGVSVDTVYRHRKTDDEFRALWAEAIEIAYDELMLEMLRRARYGTEKPIIYGGKKMGVFHDLNDTMAMRLLSMHLANVASHKTEKYNNGKQSDMTNSDDTHQLLMQRINDIKRRLNSADEVKSIAPQEAAVDSDDNIGDVPDDKGNIDKQ